MVGVICKCVRLSVVIHIFPCNGVNFVFGCLRCTAVVQYSHKYIVKCLLSGKAGAGRVVHFTGREIDGAAQRLMDSADIKHENSVDVYPHVVIAGEFEDHRIPAVSYSIFKLGEVRLQLHSCEEIRNAFGTVDVFVSTAITDRQFADNLTIRVFVSVLIHQSGNILGHINIVKRHIVAVGIICMTR